MKTIIKRYNGQKLNECLCGCGFIVKPGYKYLQGHNLRINNPSQNPKILQKIIKTKKKLYKEGKLFVPIFKQHTEKSKQKIGIASKRRWQNPEYREKLRKSHIGKHCGKNSPLYIDGRSKLNNPYPEEFYIKRPIILKKDNYTCQICGITQRESIRKYNQYLHIHHIDENKKNNKLNNLITLCCSCHGKVHINKINYNLKQYMKFNTCLPLININNYELFFNYIFN